jgi:7-carboxy-7-deazaguanine synthase
LELLLDLGRERGLTFAMETQGSKAKAWFSKLDFLVLSPKPPSSQMTTDWDDVARCIECAGAAQTSLKIVIFDENDYAFARVGSTLFPDVPLYLQVGTGAPASVEKIRAKTEWLLEILKRDHWFDVTLLPQMHVLLWGDKRGV